MRGSTKAKLAALDSETKFLDVPRGTPVIMHPSQYKAMRKLEPTLPDTPPESWIILQSKLPDEH